MIRATRSAWILICLLNIQGCNEGGQKSYDRISGDNSTKEISSDTELTRLSSTDNSSAVSGMNTSDLHFECPTAFILEQTNIIVGDDFNRAKCKVSNAKPGKYIYRWFVNGKAYNSCGRNIEENGSVCDFNGDSSSDPASTPIALGVYNVQVREYDTTINPIGNESAASPTVSYTVVGLNLKCETRYATINHGGVFQLRAKRSLVGISSDTVSCSVSPSDNIPGWFSDNLLSSSWDNCLTSVSCTSTLVENRVILPQFRFSNGVDVWAPPMYINVRSPIEYSKSLKSPPQEMFQSSQAIYGRAAGFGPDKSYVCIEVADSGICTNPVNWNNLSQTDWKYDGAGSWTVEYGANKIGAAKYTTHMEDRATGFRTKNTSEVR